MFIFYSWNLKITLLIPFGFIVFQLTIHVINNYNLNIWEKRDVMDRLEFQGNQKVNNIYFMHSNTITYTRSDEKRLDRSLIPLNYLGS